MKKIFLSLILIAITLNSNPIDAKQLFNIEKVKVKKESFKESRDHCKLELYKISHKVPFNGTFKHFLIK